MRIRSGLLVACMVVVPLIAMFSHRLPPGTRAAIVDFLRRPPRLDPVRPVPGAVAVQAPVATTPAASAPAQHVVPVVAMSTVSESDTSAWQRLRTLGAVALDCRPLQGGTGHVATCRVPVDAAGQLERVFQATGPDSTAAMDNLLREVVAWRRGASDAARGLLHL